jgi:hypothetical protein
MIGKPIECINLPRRQHSDRIFRKTVWTIFGERGIDITLRKNAFQWIRFTVLQNSKKAKKTWTDSFPVSFRMDTPMEKRKTKKGVAVLPATP